MIVGLDTSIVVRLLCGEPEDAAGRALEFLEGRRQAGDSILISNWVVAETYHALQHHYGATKRETLEALRALLSTPGIDGTGDVAEILATPGLESARPGFVDRLIHRDYLQRGADKVATFETSATKLQKSHVLS